ncbi:hypothetical protein HIM_08756 [Hirsutella minnesotensis 3608]|uniref:Ketoreductase domain-containing protein n=1 Tax=Hirsutella minnesotensis 3608 TaxID=1043627 RepID=A0A0F7ZSR6_9HYPO|nr:hypothetical protein HIM_08756 [Hirsutella minnesotensis 3608]
MASPSTRMSVLITGCTPGGIGHALAVEFHNQGCHVIATARNLDVLEELGDMGMTTLRLDVADAASVAACRAQVAELTGGRLDILVNNAGRGHTIPALDADLDDVRQTYEINVFGVMNMCQTFTPLLIPARGLIINMSSAASVFPYVFAAVDSSSKGAVNAYSRVLRMELRPLHVRVMVSMTGTVRSNIASRPERSLPPGSLYAPVADYFQHRLGFSQENAPMPSDRFARRLVRDALRGEPRLWGLVGGSSDWFWAGGMSFACWLASCLPNWVTETVADRCFGIGVLTKRIQDAASAKRD